MKTLYLVRHAKSDWNINGIADIDRPLNFRGYRDAHAMSGFMKEKKLLPDLIISSPAIRAISTALIFCRNLKMRTSEIIINPDLYETSINHYIDIIRHTDERFRSIILFAHNPIISNLASGLITSLTENLPTCATVGIQLPSDCKEWKNFYNATGELILYDFPKNHI
jgi:phosphohistidine phosphatase